MTIETPRDLQGLLAIGRIVGQALRYMREQLRPGMTTQELDQLAQQFLQRHDARSAPALAVGFPGTTCISINEQAAHGLPGARRIQPGDLVKLDVSAELNGYYAATALQAAIAAAQVGQPLHRIGRAAEQVAQRHGYRIVRALHGHGIGRGLHEAPTSIPQFYDPAANQRLTEGLVLALEPHITAGSAGVTEQPDGWTITTRDRSPVAAYEHTIIVTKNQPIIVTAA